MQRLARLSPGDILNMQAIMNPPALARSGHVIVVERIEPVVNAQGITTSLNIHVLEQTPPVSTRRVWNSQTLQNNGYVGRILLPGLEQDYSWFWQQ
jgi:hypothetical protein